MKHALFETQMIEPSVGQVYNETQQSYDVIVPNFLMNTFEFAEHLAYLHKGHSLTLYITLTITSMNSVFDTILRLECNLQNVSFINFKSLSMIDKKNAG